MVTGERRPNVRITDVAREFGTSRAQVRRVLKREGLYDQLKRMPLVTPAEKHEKSIDTVEFFLCDLHIPHHNERALSIAYREMLDIQPDRIWIGGDLLGFHKISHFNRDPEEADIADEIEKGKDFIAQLRTDFPNAEIVLEGGNHDDGRWEAYLSNTNIKGVDGVDIDQILNLDMFDVKYISAQEEKQHLCIDVLLNRVELYSSIANNNRSQEKFLRGWLNRVFKLKQQAGL